MGTKTTRIKRSASRARSSDDGLRWSVERRLAFIEEHLFWLGEVNRTDIVQKFGVSIGQASADIARYLALSPKGVSYDKSAKRYVADVGFRPVLTSPDAARFLNELRIVGARLLSADATTLGWVPPFDATPLPDRKVDPLVLRSIITAIRKELKLELEYQSMSCSEPIRRVIEPHALAYDGFRWHVRAFDQHQQQFRDFVLGRIVKPKFDGPASSSSKDDVAWHQYVSLEIAPHPKLTPAQAKAIALDYGLSGGKAKIKVRRALLYYALRRLGLDVDPGLRSPQEQHIILKNRQEIEFIGELGRTSD